MRRSSRRRSKSEGSSVRSVFQSAMAASKAAPLGANGRWPAAKYWNVVSSGPIRPARRRPRSTCCRRSSALPSVRARDGRAEIFQDVPGGPAGADGADDGEDDVLGLQAGARACRSPRCPGPWAGGPCQRVWVARTCSTSLVPMPKARAPKAPWVLVWLSPQTIVGPGRVSPSSGPMTWTIPCRPLLHVVAASRRTRGSWRAGPRPGGATSARGCRAGRRSARCGRPWRTVRSGLPHRAAGEPQALERLRAGHLVDEVAVDVQQRRVVGRLDRVSRPHLLEQRLAHGPLPFVVELDRHPAIAGRRRPVERIILSRGSRPRPSLLRGRSAPPQLLAGRSRRPNRKNARAIRPAAIPPRIAAWRGSDSALTTASTGS